MTFRGFLVFLGIAGICASLSALFFAAYMQSESSRFLPNPNASKMDRA